MEIDARLPLRSTNRALRAAESAGAREAPSLEVQKLARRFPSPRSTQAASSASAFFPTTIRRAFSTMSQLGIRIEY